MEFVLVTGAPCSGKSTWIAEHAENENIFARGGLGNDPKAIHADREAFINANAGRDGVCYIESCNVPDMAIAPGDTIKHIPMGADEETCLAHLHNSDREEKETWAEIIHEFFPDNHPAYMTAQPPARKGANNDISPSRKGETMGRTVQEVNEMADEPKQSQAEAKPEPSESQTDWKAEARKWEKRAKQNQKANEDMQTARESEASEMSEKLAKAQAEIKELKAKQARDQSVREIAKSSGVDPDILSRMIGDSEDEIKANADLLYKSSKAKWPTVPDDGGATKGQKRITKEQILAIKDPVEQANVAARNLDAFK